MVEYKRGTVLFSGCPADAVSQAAAIQYCHNNNFSKQHVKIIKTEQGTQTFINVIKL